jgi:hypothetical protein
MGELFCRAEMINVIISETSKMGFMYQAVGTPRTKILSEIWLVVLIFLLWWRGFGSVEEHVCAIGFWIVNARLSGTFAVRR